MSIQEDILYSAGALAEHYSAGDYIFRKGDIPQYYYQILTGNVKLNSYKQDKEVVQEILFAHSSVGESMFILRKPYLMNAVALSNCTVIKISTEHFLALLHLHPNIFLDIYSILADASFENAIMMDSLTNRSTK
ncbi:cyclic nucleotide-binding domain-containing protein [Chryseobacterium indoltheticum]|uniref:Transcriptional activator FtrB n=1 Tax=Chryseobacterium indoltheticum TaxID=254 RepID=A0A381FQJ1_9FLAO|nr:cyclic nucleotide-binding domain-containing protein [Chryseobacterium indoltheticum]SUX48714.1 transcriptional activator FtrB [Chryseobacterium indoltheticum]